MNAPTNIQIINGPGGKPAFVVIPSAISRAAALAGNVGRDWRRMLCLGAASIQCTGFSIRLVPGLMYSAGRS